MSEADLETPGGFTVTGGLTITDGITVTGGTIDFSGASSSNALTLTDLSATTAAAGTTGLAYDNTTGVFTYTPADLSSYLTNATLTGSDLDMGGNKVLFANMYSAEGNLPSATTYHGMFAHVHGTGKGYFAHNGNWVKLIDETSSTTDDLTEGSTNLYYTDTRARAAVSATTAAAGAAALSYNSSTGQFTLTPPDLSSYLTDITGESLSDLSNVASTAPTDGQVLTYDTTNGWQPETPSNSGGSTAYLVSEDTASATASGTDSLALGGAANARNHLYATALGTLATVGDGSQSDISNQYSVAVGWSSLAEGNRSVALGSYARTQFNSSIAIGSSNSNATTIKTQAYGLGAIAMGYASVAGVETTGANYPVAIGGLTDATANYATALGASAQATHEGSTALGYGATTSATNEVVLGGSAATQLTAGNYKFDIDQTVGATEDDYVLTYNNTSGLISLEAAAGGGGLPSNIAVSGTGTATATGSDSVAIGNGASTAANFRSIAIGLSASAQNSNGYTTAIGYSATASGNSSIAIGEVAEAYNDHCIAIGRYSDAVANYSISLGSAAVNGSTSTGSVAIGWGATNGRDNQVSVGKGATCGNYVNGGVSIGPYTLSSGISTVSVGCGYSTTYRTKAYSSGQAFGAYAYAQSNGTAVGYQAYQTGSNATAVGLQSNATGSNATALGNGANANANNKFVLGNSSITDLRCQDTSISAVSDRRDKTDIETLAVGLDFVNAIEPKAFYKNNRNDYYVGHYTQEQLNEDLSLVQTYNFDQEAYEAATHKFNKREFGFIAQDVAAQLPEQYNDARVSFPETDDLHGFDVQRFTMGDMTPILWKALRELSDKHDQLQSDYDALLARVVALENA